MEIIVVDPIFLTWEGEDVLCFQSGLLGGGRELGPKGQERKNDYKP